MYFFVFKNNALILQYIHFAFLYALVYAGIAFVCTYISNVRLHIYNYIFIYCHINFYFF